jgi:3-oxoacyl-(acyl-carrier-protein) synthase
MVTNNHYRRVVVTGMGVIAPNGQDLETFWNSIRNGISGAKPLTRFDCTQLGSRFRLRSLFRRKESPPIRSFHSICNRCRNAGSARREAEL